MAIDIEFDDDGSFSTKMGFTLDDIASAAREGFTQAVGRDCGKWDDVSNQVQEHWRDGVDVLLETVRLEVEASWLAMAKRMCFAFHREDQWDGLDDVLKVAWEVAARQAVNYVMAEDADDVREIQDMDWMSWASRRIFKEEVVNEA